MFGKTYNKEFTVEGMHCMHCAKKVEDALKKIKGVKKVNVDLQSKTVTVTSKTEVDGSLVTSAIQDLGYSVK